MDASISKLFVPPGHFYSPIVDPDQIDGFNLAPVETNSELDLNSEEQLALLSRTGDLGLEFPSQKIAGGSYYSANDQFGDGDAFTYSGILRYLQPRRVIEVGGGFSTCVLWDSAKMLRELAQVCVIEPFPDRLQSALAPECWFQIFEERVQKVSMEVFLQLDRGDILFIDSSHVAKSGSDVLFELLVVIPRLRPGVWVHFHDIFWPFEYPSSWIYHQNRSWNELYFLRAWLAYNKSVKIRFFSHYLFQEFPSNWKAAIPDRIGNTGGGFWIETLGT